MTNAVKSVRVIPPQRPLTSLQSSAHEQLGFFDLSLLLQQRAEVAYRGQRVFVVASLIQLASLKSSAYALLGLAELTHTCQQAPEAANSGKGGFVVLA